MRIAVWAKIARIKRFRANMDTDVRRTTGTVSSTRSVPDNVETISATVAVELTRPPRIAVR